MGVCDKCGTGCECLCPRCTVPFLTARELLVLELIAKGLEWKEIAHKIHYSGTTVKRVKQSLIKKLGARARAPSSPHLVSRAYQLGILKRGSK